MMSEDVIKDILHIRIFWDFGERARYSEEDLEQKIIDNLQILVGIRKRTTFVGRQYPLTVNNIKYELYAKSQ